MLNLSSGRPYKLIQSVADLPNLPEKINFLYRDAETNGLHPYNGDRACGWALTWDEEPTCFYIPMRHQFKRDNLPVEAAVQYLQDAQRRSKKWVNHGIKFDAHAARVDGEEMSAELVDTLTMCKLLYSDRWTGYGLKEICHDWLQRSMDAAAKIKHYIKSQDAPDYSYAPADLLGEYACDDVDGNRQLHKFLRKEMPEDVYGVVETEVALTSVLFDAECEGLHVDERELKLERLRCIRNLITLGDELKNLAGFEMNPKSKDDVYDALITQCGLPVLAFTKQTVDEEGDVHGGNPSFDKKAIALYKNHPAVLNDPKTLRIVELIHEFRSEAQHLGLYVESYLDHQSGGVLHPFYNQCVRTGRMSGSQPNPQQLNTRAKALIHPKLGWAFLSYDYSQIEYRLIAHYIENERAIQAYNEDPYIDFHQWVADLIGVKRKAGKTLNFGMGYGMGKAKLTAALSVAPEIVAEVSEQLNREIAEGVLDASMRMMEFDRRCVTRANDVFAAYHENLPELKPTSRAATSAAKHRGYVFNAYGRRRHLEHDFAHKAFNSVIQSCAADIMKERTVAIAPRNDKYLRDRNIHIVASVHDETLFTGPIEVMRDPAVRRYIRERLEDTRVKFSVPIKTDCGYSERSWADASDDDGKLCLTCFARPRGADCEGVQCKACAA